MDGPFGRSLELAWQSCVEGNVGVGAVITDASGAIVAEGRNRVRSPPSGAEPIEGTTLAHAEMNALVKLPLRATGYGDHTVWTTLEPCIQCAAAMHVARTGHIRYLAADPYWDGAHRLADVLPELHAGRCASREGPGDGVAAAFAALLPLHYSAFWFPDSGNWRWWRATHPRWSALAEGLVASGQLVQLAVDDAPLDVALAELDLVLRPFG